MKQLVKLLLFPGMLVSLANCKFIDPGEPGKGQVFPGDDRYRLVWSDEFNNPGLPESTKWNYDTEGNEDGWGNFEDQVYTEARVQNAKVDDGVLHIIACRENFGDKKYTSARLTSRADWKYGIIEVRARIPDGRGTWAAIWMMPGNWTFKDRNWPDVGEIDIMEHVGFDKGIVHASAHSRDYQWQTGTEKTDTMSVPDVSCNFHSYLLKWSPEVIRSFVDDSLYFEYKNEGLGESKWPYNKPFYLILNLAVGGGWGGARGIDEDVFPQTLEVDYVRVYQMTGKGADRKL